MIWEGHSYGLFGDTLLRVKLSLGEWKSCQKNHDFSKFQMGLGRSCFWNLFEKITGLQWNLF